MRFSAGILYEANAQYLLLQRSGSGLWSIPGGGIESVDQSLWDTAVRETEEETGTAPRGKKRGEVTCHKGSSQYTTFLISVAYPFQVQLNHEHSDWGWFGAKQIKRLRLHPGLCAAGLIR